MTTTVFALIRRAIKSHRRSVFILLLALLARAAPTAGADPSVTNTTRLPEVTVFGKALPIASEEDLVGAYKQPEWTFHRRFPTTRVYLQKEPWEMGFEQWWRGRFLRDGRQAHKFQTEFEIGLPHRFQFDLYEKYTSDARGRMRHLGVSPELRWAPADWGVIPLNPTIYAEWQFTDKSRGPDVYEIKLLLGEQLAPRWHWGVNFIYEQEVGGGRATEMTWSQGVSHTLIDQRLSAGLEMRFAHETANGSRGQPEITYMLGPSVQWRPWSRFHLDLVPLFGITRDAPKMEAFVVFSFDLGTLKGSSRYTPTSLRGQ